MIAEPLDDAGDVTLPLPVEGRAFDPRLLDRIGGYSVEGSLGSGAMSVVLRVRDPEDDAVYAMKVLRSTSADRVGRFAAEAMAMTAVVHPNVPRLVTFGHDPVAGVHYLVMELATLGSAAEASEELGPLPTELAAAWLVQVSCALSAAHAVDIVHRDVKSGNILVAADGRAMLSDFGIAWVPGLALPTSHGVLGSVSYMAPEQRHHPDRAGPAMDVYAAGATLYHLATRGSPVDLYLAAPGDLRWDRVPRRLRPIVVRATRWNPVERYPTARAMALDLALLVPDEVWRAQPHLVTWLHRAG